MNYKLAQFLLSCHNSNFIDFNSWNRIYKNCNDTDKNAFLHWATNVDISYGREMIAFTYKNKSGNPIKDSIKNIPTEVIKTIKEDENIWEDIRKSAQIVLEERTKVKFNFSINQINCKFSTEHLSGWLSPSGEFFSVAWGEHERFAGDYIFKHNLTKERKNYKINGGEREYKDFLIQVKRFVLLDNPSNDGKTNISYKTLSNAQKKFLEEYFIKINDNEALKEILND